MSNKEHHIAAGELGTDIVKQFLTISLAGIAFTSGLVFSDGVEITRFQFYLTSVAFSISAILGFLFLMNRVYLIREEKDYDPYSKSAKWFSISQIGFFVIGVIGILNISNSKLKSPYHNGNSEPVSITITKSDSLLKELKQGEEVIILFKDSTATSFSLDE